MNLLLFVIWLSVVVFGIATFIVILRDNELCEIRQVRIAKGLALYGIGLVTVLTAVMPWLPK